MAYIDYLRCCVCGCKVVYDADVNYDWLDTPDEQVKGLCNSCFERFSLVPLRKKHQTLEVPKQEENGK